MLVSVKMRRPPARSTVCASSARHEPATPGLYSHRGDVRGLDHCPALHLRAFPLSLWRQESGHQSQYGQSAPAHPRQSRLCGGQRRMVLSRAGRTLMFATTALSKEDGLQEYPFAEPFYATAPDGSKLYDLQPSIHFRAGGKAIVAWCDAHITLEAPNDFKDTNFYGGNNAKHEI